MSSFIQFNQVSFTYDKLSSLILNQINVAFHEGWSSICGANGCGKTTLLRLIQGELKPLAGHILIQGSIAYVPQETRIPPANMEEFRFDYSPEAVLLKASFGIVDDWFDRWLFLSVGQRKKMQIAAAIFQNSAILLVDEPTNHVDADTKLMILNELKKAKCVGLLISHDRLLLNTLCQQTIFIDEGQCQVFQAPYDVACAELEAMHHRAQHLQSLKKDEFSKIKEAAQRQTERVDQKKHQLSKKNIDKKDHDAKEKIDRARLFGADNSDTRKKKILSEKSQRLEKQLGAMPVKKEYKLGVFFEDFKQSKTLFLPENTLVKSFISIKYPTIYAKPGDKIAIMGNNGSGKSTFLSYWAEKIVNDDVIFAKQEATLLEQEQLMHELNLLDAQTKGKVMTLVRCLGSDPKTVLEAKVPSPGVWQKIVIAKAIVLKMPILFLDEPTNHMDLAAIEILEEALKRYQGILVAISHDMHFVENVCDKILCFTKSEDLTTVLVEG